MDPEKPEGGEKPAQETPKFITEEELTKLLGTRFKAFEKVVADTIGKVTEQIVSRLPKEEPAPPAPPAPDADEPKKKDPELKKLQDQIATLTQKAEQAERERDQERAKAKDSALRQKVGEALTAAGIDGVRARHVIGLLVDAEKRVRWGEDGETPIFHTPDREDVELPVGLAGWLKSDEGKFFLPPRGTQGSGDRPGAAPPSNSNAPLDRKTVAEGLARALTGRL